jgi:hypothetical protein
LCAGRNATRLTRLSDQTGQVTRPRPRCSSRSTSWNCSRASSRRRSPQPPSVLRSMSWGWRRNAAPLNRGQPSPGGGAGSRLTAPSFCPPVFRSGSVGCGSSSHAASLP